jgi:hypothetical protein
MIEQRLPLAAWLQPVDSLIRAGGNRGGFLVALPEYRPDLVQQMAAALDFEFFDFRLNVLLPLGWDAGRLGLDALTDEIAERAGRHGLVVHNAEALLATKEAHERRDWFETFLARPWPHPALIPIAIYQGDLPLADLRFHRVDPDTLPEETLLGRLATR